MTEPGRGASGRRRLGFAGVVAACALLVAACTSTVSGQPLPGSSAPSGGSHASMSGRPGSAPAQHVAVHVSVNISDGSQVGVGMPYIARFDRKFTDASAFAAATSVYLCQHSASPCSASTGEKVDARWYFEYSDPNSGHVMEAHLRMRDFWPAHSSIFVDLPVKGVAAGAVRGRPNSEYVFGDSLTSSFSIGDARIVTVSNADHDLTVVDDGKPWGTFPVSLGAPDTRTKHGIKVIMEQVKTVCMHDVDNSYHECGIKWDSRLTYDGEYLHSAPWNCKGAPGCIGPGNLIGSGNSSNGCTNLRPGDAVKLFDFLKPGDPVEFPDADGQRMQLGDGYGDWNVSWPVWQTGGVLRTQ